jgi:predicted metalloendopeptidase
VFAGVIDRAHLEEMYTGDFAESHPWFTCRVNALISSLNCFYELYNIKEGDAMYTAPEARPYLWQ